MSWVNDYWDFIQHETVLERQARRVEKEERFREVGAMARVSEEYGSSFLKASDLQGKTVPCQIAKVAREEFQSGDIKWVVSFLGKDKRFVLNKTNAELIAQMHGDDMDLWTGKTIKIFPTKTNMQGNMVDCIRVKDEAPEVTDADSIPF
jgi:hypothetical protein